MKHLIDDDDDDDVDDADVAVVVCNIELYFGFSLKIYINERFIYFNNKNSSLLVLEMDTQKNVHFSLNTGIHTLKVKQKTQSKQQIERQPILYTEHNKEHKNANLRQDTHWQDYYAGSRTIRHY
jgi:hypothetical protein